MNRIVPKLAIVCTAVALLVTGCIEPPSEVRNVKQYASCLEAFAPELVAHFPTSASEEDRDPVFSYFAGFLQGGAHIQLRLRLPPEEVANLARDLQGKTRHAYQGGSRFTHYNSDQQNNVPTASYHTQRDDQDAYEFPDHFTLYVLEATTSSSAWNHGRTYGIAVSEETSEAIYWAENW